MLKYKVPFFLWANYDIEEQRDIETSINYLSTILLKTCGFELPAYNRFLSAVEEPISILSADAYYSESRAGFMPFSEATEEKRDIESISSFGI